MRFGDDWTGVFIRGDNATYYAHHIKTLISLIKSPQDNVDTSAFAEVMMKGLLSDLESCIHVKGNPPAQVMKEFEECIDEKEEGESEA